MARIDNLEHFLSDVADAIREKTGGGEPIQASNFDTEIRSISTGVDMTTVFDKIYPVGSIYMSTTNTNPGTLFTGTWIAWGSGKVPVGVDTGDSDFSTVEKSAGSKTHTHTQGATGAATGNTGSTTLTVDQMPSHKHGVANAHPWNERADEQYRLLRVNTPFVIGYNAVDTDEVGGNQGHTHTLNSHTHTNPTTASSSNLQPYITCYMWKRTN